MWLSKGLKRKIVGLLQAVLEFVRPIPEFAMVVPVIEQLIGALGGVAVAHAAVDGTVAKYSLGSLASIVSVLLAISYFIPAMAPLIPWLQKLAALLGAGAVGAAFKK